MNGNESNTSKNSTERKRRVSCYRNLHKKCWSVIGREGRVEKHATSLVLDDVKFVVRQGGYERALREGKRNVHAFARGTVSDAPCEVTPGAVPVTYNPYGSGTFFNKLSGEPVVAAKRAFLTQDNKVWAEL